MRGIAAQREVVHVKLTTDARDHADERIFLNPHLKPDGLVLPLVSAIAVHRCPDDLFGAVPRAQPAKGSRAVLHGVPIDQARHASLGDYPPEGLVGSERVLAPASRDELIVDLPKSELESLRLILLDDLVCLLYFRQRLALKLLFHIFGHGHFFGSPYLKASRA